MNGKSMWLLVILIPVVLIALMSTWIEREAATRGATEAIGNLVDGLPPTAAGVPSAAGLAGASSGASSIARAEAYLGGSKAIGRVSEVYIRVAENVYLSTKEAPQHLRSGVPRYVDIEFPSPLAKDIGSARALLDMADAEVETGDVVEIRFAHKDNPRFFPVREVTRVTGLVAKKDAMLAQEFERRILARNAQASAPLWQIQARAAQGAAKPESARGGSTAKR